MVEFSVDSQLSVCVGGFRACNNGCRGYRAVAGFNFDKSNSRSNEHDGMEHYWHGVFWVFSDYYDVDNGCGVSVADYGGNFKSFQGVRHNA